MYETNVKIPAKHYVGMVKRETEKIPLGFITPWGEDSAAKKRIATVDAWAKQGYYGGKALPSMVIDNVPMAGFKMTTDIRSSSYGGVDKWRIQDPRGFELEITSHNLAQLLDVGMIDRGEIMDTCVWARNGQQNVLLSTNTEEYKAALQNTAVSEMKADWKDVQVGNTVLLQNNTKGVWLGRMHGVVLSSPYYGDKSKDNNMLSATDKSIHLIYVEQPEDKSFRHKLMLVNSPKLAAIVDTTTMPLADAEIKANQLLTDKSCYIESAGYKDYLAFTFGSAKFGSTALLSLEPVTINSEAHLEELTYYRGKFHVFTTTSDTAQYIYRITSSKNYRNNTPQFAAGAFSRAAFDQHELRMVGGMYQDGSMWNRHSYWRQTSHDYVFSTKDQFYTGVITIETKSGNTLKAYIH